MGKISYLLRKLVILPILFYQLFIKPVIRPCCRFYPSCSEYALQSIMHYGVIKGLRLTSSRLLRCHPWTEGGYDPVLPNKEKY